MTIEILSTSQLNQRMSDLLLRIKTVDQQLVAGYMEGASKALDALRKSGNEESKTAEAIDRVAFAGDVMALPSTPQRLTQEHIQTMARAQRVFGETFFDAQELLTMQSYKKMLQKSEHAQIKERVEQAVLLASKINAGEVQNDGTIYYKDGAEVKLGRKF